MWLCNLRSWRFWSDHNWQVLVTRCMLPVLFIIEQKRIKPAQQRKEMSQIYKKKTQPLWWDTVSCTRNQNTKSIGGGYAFLHQAVSPPRTGVFLHQGVSGSHFAIINPHQGLHPPEPLTFFRPAGFSTLWEDSVSSALVLNKLKRALHFRWIAK